MILVLAAALSTPWLLGCIGNQDGPWTDSVTVVCEAPGRAPEEVEELVTIPIERAVNGVPGVADITAMPGVCA